MQVKVKLFATLRIGRDKEMMMNMAEGATVRDIIDQLDISEQDAAIIFINGRGVKLAHVLIDDDTLSIFPAVGGG